MALVMFGRKSSDQWTALGFANDFEFAKSEATTFFKEEDWEAIRLVDVDAYALAVVVAEFRPVANPYGFQWPVVDIPVPTDR